VGDYQHYLYNIRPSLHVTRSLSLYSIPVLCSLLPLSSSSHVRRRRTHRSRRHIHFGFYVPVPHKSQCSELHVYYIILSNNHFPIHCCCCFSHNTQTDPIVYNYSNSNSQITINSNNNSNQYINQSIGCVCILGFGFLIFIGPDTPHRGFGMGMSIVQQFGTNLIADGMFH